MSISLNGSSQYISLGTDVDIQSAMPLTIAVVVQSTSISGALKGLFSQGDYNANTGWGAGAYGGPPKKLFSFGAMAGANTDEPDGTSNLITSDNGWYLVLITYRKNGTKLESSLSTYSYTGAAWVGTDTVLGSNNISSASTSFQAPSGGTTTVIGAITLTTITDFWNTNISWIAIFDQDYSTNPSADANAIELAANGFWNLLNSHCKLAIAFNNNTTDQSGNGHDGTLIGAPSYGAAGPGELPPVGGGIHIWVPMTGGIKPLTGGIYG